MGNAIQTVTGSVPVEKIALADGHEHVWINPAEGISPDARIELRDYERIQQELEQFHQAGGTLLVDCQPGDAGRDTLQLRRLSEQTGVLITATTGAHQRKYYSADSWLWQASADAAAQHFIRELTEGTRESLTASQPVRAAIIKIGYEGVIEGQTQVLMEAAASASRQTGASILFHTEMGRNIEALLPFFERQGVPANRLYMCHVDKRPDVGLHRELTQAGVLLGYDTFGRPKYDPDRNVWPLITALAADGLAGGIAVCLDFAFSSFWKSFGGEPGLTFLQSHILPRLAQIGLDAATIKQLTAQNVAERLAR
jgi:predicted metal-dependent phosphotriesterase family hydrolase